MGFDFQARI